MADSNLRTSEQLGIGEVASIPPHHIDFGMPEQPISEQDGISINCVIEPVDIRPLAVKDGRQLGRRAANPRILKVHEIPDDGSALSQHRQDGGLDLRKRYWRDLATQSYGCD